MSHMMKKKKRSSNQYFTRVHEEAIIKYASSEDLKERTKLYVEFIAPAFHEMVEKITFTYRFTSLPNIDSLKEECKVWLTTILDKFDPSRGFKAFSYFSVITKNWFVHKTKKNAQKNRREIEITDVSKEIEEEFLSIDNLYLSSREEAEFWALLVSEIDRWRDESLKDNERRVLDAIKYLFDNIDKIEIFNKKAVYLYLRELTGLSTKQVVNSLNKLRTKYKSFKRRWDSQ